ncbi:MAG: ABC transporter permease subunit, partial [Candidatus Thermoplasmatota archaeon]
MRTWRAAALPAAFLLLFLVLPLYAILHVAGPATELGAWERGRLGVSVQLGVLTAILALFFGLPLAYLLGKHRFRGRRALRAAVTVPFVMPVVVIAAGLSALLGPRHTGTYAALLLAHTVYNVPLVVRLVGDTWAHLDPRPEDAAATLGAGPRERFLRVTLPRLAPSIAAAALLAFLFGFTAFGTVLLLADPIRDATIEVAIYHTGMRLFDLPTAATLAVLQLVVTFVAALTYATLIERASTRERAVSESETLRPLGRGNRALVALAFLFAALLLLPLATIVVRAFDTPSGWSVAAFQRLVTGGVQNVSFTTPLLAARNSAFFALCTIAIAVPLGVLGALAVARAAKRSAWLDALWMVPLGTSAVTLGLGLLLVFPWR